jgi:hypothetical protein
VHPSVEAEVGAPSLRPRRDRRVLAEAAGGVRQRPAHLRARDQVGDGAPERLALHDPVGCDRGDPGSVLACQPALEGRAAQHLLDGVAGAVLPCRGFEHRRDDALGHPPFHEAAADDLRQRARERRVDRALGLVGQDSAHRSEGKAVQHRP